MNKILALFVGILLVSKDVSAQPLILKHSAKSASVNKGLLSILLLLNTSAGGENTADGAGAIFNDDYSTALGDEDSYKFTNPDENIAINRNGVLLSTEGRPGIIGTDTLPLKIYNYRQTNYILRFKGSNFADSLTAVLKDLWLGTETPVDLATTTSLSFSINTSDASSASNRFSIIFRSRSVPVAFTRAPADTVACPGSNVTLSAVAQGFYLAWQWQVSTNGGGSYSNVSDGGIYSGATTSSLTISGVTTALNNYLYRVAVSGLSPVSSAISAPARFSIGNTWAGSSNSNWGDASNWACLVVPTLTDDILVPGSVANMPVLTAAQGINNMILQANADLNLNGQFFTVDGTVSGTGAISGSATSALTLNGAGAETIYFNQGIDPGTNVLQSLTVNHPGSVVLGSRLYITGVMNVAGGTLNANGRLTIRSTSIANTARIAALGSGASITGNVTVERFIPARRAYRFLSPSVTTSTSIRANWMEGQSNPYPAYSGNSDLLPGFGTHITGSANVTDSFDATRTNAPSLYSFDNNMQVYNPTANTHGLLTAGVPLRLFVRGNRSTDLSSNTSPASNTILRATGIVGQGDITYNTNTNPALSGTINNFNGVGNPYPSPVSWTKLQRNNLSETYYILDPNLSNGRGVYVNYNILSGSNNIASAISDDIQSGQGFFVQTVGASPSLAFKESFKSTGTNTAVYKDPAGLTRLGIQLVLDSSGTVETNTDGVAIVFGDDFSGEFGKEDAVKITNRDENIAVVAKDKLLSIDGLPTIKSVDTLHLKLWQYRTTNYYLKFDPANWQKAVSALLIDNYLHSQDTIDLSAVSYRKLDITGDSASSASVRFSIVFEPNIVPVAIKLTAAINGKGIEVNWSNPAEADVDSYAIERSTNGQQFEKVAVVSANGNSGSASNYSWFDENASSGISYYRIKIADKSGAFSYSQITEVVVYSANETIAVYPNPVKNKLINLHLAKLDKGRYNLTILNSLGQKVFATVIEHGGSPATYPVQISKSVGKGVYGLKLSNHKTAIITNVVFE